MDEEDVTTTERNVINIMYVRSERDWRLCWSERQRSTSVCALGMTQHNIDVFALK